jgi:CMP-N-acetylneuraminic acid synthetase
MRIAGFIPSRLNSQRVNRKNIRLLGGVPLINYSLEALNSVPAIGENVIFASEPSICDFVREGLRYRYVKRPDYLDTQEAKVQDFWVSSSRRCRRIS